MCLSGRCSTCSEARAVARDEHDKLHQAREDAEKAELAQRVAAAKVAAGTDLAAIVARHEAQIAELLKINEIRRASGRP